MKKLIKVVSFIILIFAISYLCFANRKTIEPNIYYLVYLDNKELGVIESKTELENYIDKKNSEYKSTFNVDKVYAPTGLEIIKINTYSDKITSIETIYKMIEASSPFTIEGYQFNIKKDENVETIYTLNKEIFNKAVQSVEETFVGSDLYELYVNDQQTDILTTGKIIKDLYINEDITIKKTNIPVTEEIYSDSSVLAKYLLFGTIEDQGSYTVKIGDTITDVAFNNQISVEEFLISNPEFTSEKNLLFPGQIVVIGITNPKLSVVVEEYVVEDKVVAYQENYQYDENRVIGDDEILQIGENGEERVSQKQQIINGVMTQVKIEQTQELKAVINQIVLKGEKNVPSVGSLTNWLWPTNKPFTISSAFAWRINPITGVRELHPAIDIAGTGKGSNIYVITNGEVILSEYQKEAGNYICINHNVGNFYTCYAHLQTRLVKVGDVVERGQVIGYMGETGYATGIHLHFEIWKGYPWKGGVRYNPCNYYNEC
ncbi:MAG: peptidoglycan DD-metalloendopeptidase family protein [Bacilli bacterium]